MSDNLPVVFTPEDRDAQVERDFGLARANVIDIIEKTKLAFDDYLGVARQSQNPRAYEVLANMMEAMVRTNRELMELQARRKDVSWAALPEEKTEVTNNNLFIGSTGELSRILSNMKQSKLEVIDVESTPVTDK